MVKKYFFILLLVLFISCKNQNSYNFDNASFASYFDVFSTTETEIDSNYIINFNDDTLLKFYRSKNFDFMFDDCFAFAFSHALSDIRISACNVC